MSLIKKSDVKNHLSPRHAHKPFALPSDSEPDATGFSTPESVGIPALRSKDLDELADAAASQGAPLSIAHKSPQS